MDQLTATASSGLRSRIEALDLLANNISNSGTPGYKSDREFYNLYVSPDADSQSSMPDIARNWIDYSQGTVKETGNPLDVALAGKGFLIADSPEGPLYTRKGSLKLSTTGILVTSEGYPVRADTPTSQLQANIGAGAGPLRILKDGSVAQDGQTLGALTLADWPMQEALEKQGGTYFRLTDSNLQPSTPTDVEVMQGRLESSNASPSELAVQMVAVLRQFEALTKAISIGAEMNKKAVEDVARVAT
jgi:flagellar basal-body rod protein FlgF